MKIELEDVLKAFDKLSNIERLKQEVNKLEKQRKRLELEVDELKGRNSTAEYDGSGGKMYEGLVEIVKIEEDTTTYYFGFLESGKETDYKEEVKARQKIT